MEWKMDKTVSYGEDFLYHSGCEIGSFSIIGKGVVFGRNVKVGNFCIIEDNCHLEDGVVLSNYVRLGPYTHLDEGVWMDSYTLASGECYVGKYSQIRYQSIIARNTIIGSDCFFCAGVKTAYLDHTGNPTPQPLKLGHAVFVGDNSTILAGLQVAEGSVIGAHSLVTRDCDKINAVYLGCPAEMSRLLYIDEIRGRTKRINNLRMGRK